MYRVRAFIDTPRFSKDYKVEKPFYLLNLLNLNDVPDIHVRASLADLIPFHFIRDIQTSDIGESGLNFIFPTCFQGRSSSSVSKKFTYLLGVKTGTVVLKAHSDMKGYTPGQVIQLTTEIHNQSGKTTGTVVACLIQV